MFLDDSACNLASLNLMRSAVRTASSTSSSFKHAVRVDHPRWRSGSTTLVPDAGDREELHDYRPLGLGYANLGALLMSRGLPYDSDDGRAYAAAITALMCGEAYATSAKIAAHNGPFAGFAQP